MESIIRRLLSDGWKEYPDAFRSYAHCFYKQFYTKTPCHCNIDKPGIQVCCAVSRIEGFNARFELELCGELEDGAWVKLLQYGLPDDIDAGLRLIPRMLDAWETMNDKQNEGTNTNG